MGLLVNGNSTPRDGRGMAPRNDLLNGYNRVAHKQGNLPFSLVYLPSSLPERFPDDIVVGGTFRLLEVCWAFGQRSGDGRYT